MQTRALLLIVANLAVLIGAAPLWPWLDLPIRIILPLTLFLSVWSDQRRRFLLAARPATLLIVSAFLWYAAHASRTEIVDPASNLLALLLALRLLTEKSGRHLLQIFILALLALSASSLYSLNSLFLLFLVLEILTIALGLFLLAFVEAAPQVRLNRKELRTLLSIGLGLPLVSLCFVPLLFFILPRTQFPLWNFLNQQQSTTSGISDHVEPGSISALSQSRRIVLRVEVPEQPQNSLYWRVIVLNTPEGQGWVRHSPPKEEVNLPAKGPRVEQLLYIEPTGEHFIPTLGSVDQWSGLRAERSGDALLLSRHPINQRSMVRATSRSDGRIRAGKPFAVNFYLTLPENLPLRVEEAAQEIFNPEDDARTRVSALETFFLQQKLRYSLTTLSGGENPLENFLFSTKSGYCEDFAVAFTTMLRLGGIPARLVGGFYGGEYSKLGGYYVITEDRAHLWVEALIDGEWERIDPTLFAINAESVGNHQPLKMRGISQWIDAFNYYWNRTVINYDLNQQIELLRKTGRATRQWNFTEIFKAGFLFIALPVGAIILFLLILPGLRRPVEERMLRQFLRQLERDKITPAEVSQGVQSLADLHPHPAAQLFARRYNAIIFSGRKATADDIKELKRLLHQLRSG